MIWVKCYNNKELEDIVNRKLEEIEKLKSSNLGFPYIINNLYTEIDLAKEQIIKNRDNKIRILLNDRLQ